MSDRERKIEQPRDYEEPRRGGTARQRAIEAYDNARDGVSKAGRRAGEAIGEAPLMVLAGGLAAGAVIAALLPRTRTETDLLRPLGRRVKDTARAATQAARDAGTSKLDELGLTRDKGVETIRQILQGVGDAARSSAQAGIGAVKNKE